ncbi:hypothetical protein B0J14DRAFT_642320 [Halenospora varia]|nr:hypothetical protein B0J14DRAFT_642320 [Halenospora varia]
MDTELEHNLKRIDAARARHAAKEPEDLNTRGNKRANANINKATTTSKRTVKNTEPLSTLLAEDGNNLAEADPSFFAEMEILRERVKANASNPLLTSGNMAPGISFAPTNPRIQNPMEDFLFTKFSEVPLELRIKIWDIAAFQQRHIKCQVKNFKENPKSIMVSPTPVPSMMHVCHESRDVGNKYYQKLSTTRTTISKMKITYINYEVDTLRFMHYDLTHFMDQTHSYSDVLPGFKALHTNLTHLTISATDTQGLQEYVRHGSDKLFKSLKKVIILSTISSAPIEEFLTSPTHIAAVIGPEYETLSDRLSTNRHEWIVHQEIDIKKMINDVSSIFKLDQEKVEVAFRALDRRPGVEKYVAIEEFVDIAELEYKEEQEREIRAHIKEKEEARAEQLRYDAELAAILQAEDERPRKRAKVE